MTKLIITVDTADLETASAKLTAIRAELPNTVGVAPVLVGKLTELQSLIDEHCAHPSITVSGEDAEEHVFVVTEAQVAAEFDEGAGCAGLQPWAQQPLCMRTWVFEAVRNVLGHADWAAGVSAVTHAMARGKTRSA